MNPISLFLQKSSPLILDGAFATELERRGYNLNDPLWSAKLLIENPAIIQEIHEAYYDAGADCVITASYQASYEGFMRRGFSEGKAKSYLQLSVTVARKARDNFWSLHKEKKNRQKPLVAASIGPYGAFLADGSEYRGNYALRETELMKFHKKRMETLIQAAPDLLACETVPCFKEARAMVRLLENHPDMYCWVSFSAKDGVHISSGEKIAECARWLDSRDQVAAIGVNCTAPQFIDSLIFELQSATDKPLIIYPNSGEDYDAGKKIWIKKAPTSSFSNLALSWYEKGVEILGGCCRTTPDDIMDIAAWARR